MIQERVLKIGLFVSILAFFAILFLRTAWLCDDAYITFRVVDNFVNGYGLRWNIDERVQVYTHPLWMLLQIPFYALAKEPFLTWIFVSFGVSMFAIFLLLLVVTENASQMLLAWSLLGFSRAFVDYSSSGLENPLSHVFLILFYGFFLKGKYNLKNLFWLSLVASLAVLNRQDCILIYLPSLLYVWWKMERKFYGFCLICLGFLPFVFWEIFSIIYYGFPFPNTAYAKLGSGVWRRELVIQGFWYFFWSWKNDLVTIVGFITAIIIPFYRYVPQLVVSVLGIVLYLLYILWIGGDFMGGRFFTVPFLLGVILILRYSNLTKIKEGVPAVLMFSIISLIQPDVPILTNASYGKDLSYYHTDFKKSSFVGNERMFYFQVASLAHWERGKPMPNNNWAQRGREYRKQDIEMVKPHGAIGTTGFFAGPKVHIVDYYALADPLLARLPTIIQPTWSSGWRIGHFGRYVPEGYLDTIANKSGENKIKDESLAQFYQHLSLITKGPIWSFDRVTEIVKMNMGLYDHLINKDYYMFPYLKTVNFSELEKLSKSNLGKITIPKNGLAIKLNELKKINGIKIESDSSTSLLISFFNGTNWLGKAKIDSQKEIEQNTIYSVSVPFYARFKGFNEIRIFPYPGDNNSSIRRIYISSD